MESTASDIELRYLLNGSEPIVQLVFEYDSRLIRLLKAHTKARWSITLQCWYIPCNEFHPEKFRRDFGTDFYLHASSAQAAAILSSIKRALNGQWKDTAYRIVCQTRSRERGKDAAVS